MPPALRRTLLFFGSTCLLGWLVGTPHAMAYTLHNRSSCPIEVRVSKDLFSDIRSSHLAPGETVHVEQAADDPGTSTLQVSIRPNCRDLLIFTSSAASFYRRASCTLNYEINRLSASARVVMSDACYHPEPPPVPPTPPAPSPEPPPPHHHHKTRNRHVSL